MRSTPSIRYDARAARLSKDFEAGSRAGRAVRITFGAALIFIIRAVYFWGVPVSLVWLLGGFE